MKKIKFSNGVEFNMSPKEFVKIIAPYIGYEDVLFKDVSECRERGYLNKTEFLKICYTKTTRNFKICIENTPEKIKYWSTRAFSQNISDLERVKNLTQLKGVGMPRASFILSAWNPIEYVTYDYRIRDVLEKKEIEDFEKPNKKDPNLWYLAELKLSRKWRDELNLKAARRVEYALYRYQFIGEISKKEFTLE